MYKNLDCKSVPGLQSPPSPSYLSDTESSTPSLQGDSPQPSLPPTLSTRRNWSKEWRTRNTPLITTHVRRAKRAQFFSAKADNRPFYRWGFHSKLHHKHRSQSSQFGLLLSVNRREHGKGSGANSRDWRSRDKRERSRPGRRTSGTRVSYGCFNYRIGSRRSPDPRTNRVTVKDFESPVTTVSPRKRTDGLENTPPLAEQQLTPPGPATTQGGVMASPGDIPSSVDAAEAHRL